MTGAGRNNNDVLEEVLGNEGNFSSLWLRGKLVVPVSVGSRMDSALRRRVAAGCRAVGATRFILADLSPMADSPHVLATSCPLLEDQVEIRPPSLIATFELNGAVLFAEAGHALVAGTSRFMSAAVAEGIDTARSRFARYANTVSRRNPSLLKVAAAYPPKYVAWSDPAQVDPTSMTAHQLTLLHELENGTRSPQDFAREWWKARRTSQLNGERLLGPLADLFEQVFMILEDYSIEPELSEPGDLSDSALREAVSEEWANFRYR